MEDAAYLRQGVCHMEPSSGEFDVIRRESNQLTPTQAGVTGGQDQNLVALLELANEAIKEPAPR
jgi:hypothetical protein